MSIETLNEKMAEIFAGIMHQDSIARCPECHNRLLVTVTIYAHMPVMLRTWGDGRKRVYYGKNLVETKADLQQAANSNYSDGGIEWREELYCESCEYWCPAQDLED